MLILSTTLNQNVKWRKIASTNEIGLLYVNPQNPDFAIIKRDISGFIIALTLIGFLMLVQTLLAYLIEANQNNAPQFLQKAHNFMSLLIGMTVLLGGIGYFVYTLILAATVECGY